VYVEIDAESFSDLDKLNLVKLYLWVWLQPIYTTAPAASKNDAHIRSSQKRFDKNHLSLLV